ncbi:hypothetical protein EMPG_14657, partial [Blastomyces silverae]
GRRRPTRVSQNRKCRPQPQQPPYAVKISTSPLRCQFHRGHRISSYTVGLVCTPSHFTHVPAHSGGDKAEKQRKNLPKRTYTAVGQTIHPWVQQRDRAVHSRAAVPPVELITTVPAFLTSCSTANNSEAFSRIAL